MQHILLNIRKNFHSGANVKSTFPIKQLNDYADNRAHCEQILSKLPGWFGPYEVFEEYLDDLKTRPVFGVTIDDIVVGLMALSETSEATIDIHLMAVAPEYHGKGIGSALVQHAEVFAFAKGKSFLTVKSLGPSHDNEFYPKTHAFYLASGFRPIEEFADFWGEGYPMLLLCKALAE